jgi:amylovoran biosynthesis glycosyltransferase AmsD
VTPAEGPGRPRTLLVGADLSTGGGVNRVIRDLSALLVEELGCEVVVASGRSHGAPSYAFPAEVPILYPRRRRYRLPDYFRFLLTLRRQRFDHAIGFWAEDNVVLALAFAFSRTKIVLCEHNSWFYPPRHVQWLRRILYPGAKRVTVLNRAELDHYRAYLDNVVLVPNPVAIAPPQPGTAREKLILGVGHLIPRKGFADLIRAFHRSALADQGWALAIIGDGPEKPALEALIASDGVKGVSLIEATPELPSWYARASLIAVSSDVEVFSLVLAEGIQAGLVAVAYAADGPAYILEQFPDHLVPIGDVEGLAQALRRAAASDLNAVNQAMRDSLEQRMSRAQVAALWREILR